MESAFLILAFCLSGAKASEVDILDRCEASGCDGGADTESDIQYCLQIQVGVEGLRQQKDDPGMHTPPRAADPDKLLSMSIGFTLCSVIVVFSVGCLVYGFIAAYITHQDGGGASHKRTIIVLGILMCTFNMMPFASIVGVQLLIQERLQIDVVQYNLIASVRSSVAIVFMCISPWLFRRLGYRQSMFLCGAGTLLNGLYYILAVWLSSYVDLAVSSCVMQCLIAFTSITVTSMNTHFALGTEQSKVASLNLIAFTLAMVAPLVFMPVITTYISLTLSVGIVVSFSGLVVFLASILICMLSKNVVVDKAIAEPIPSAESGSLWWQACCFSVGVSMGTSISSTVETNVMYIFSLKPNVSYDGTPGLILVGIVCQSLALLAAMLLDTYGGRPLAFVVGGAVMTCAVASAAMPKVPALIFISFYGLGHGLVESATRSSLALLVPSQAIPGLLAMQGVMGSLLNILLPALYATLEVKMKGLGIVWLARLLGLMTFWLGCVSAYNFLWGHRVLFGTAKFDELSTGTDGGSCWEAREPSCAEVMPASGRCTHTPSIKEGTSQLSAFLCWITAMESHHLRGGLNSS